jgi:hypothetical protein
MSRSASVVVLDALANYLEAGIAEVDGWLSPFTAAAIAHLLVEQSRAGLRGDVCEIGVHHGKLFLVLATALMDDERAVAVDVFADQDKNLDGSGRGDRAVFERHLAERAPGARVEIVQESSLDLAATGFLAHRFRFVSIDGSHTAAATANDLGIAEATLLPGGVAVLDDVLSENWTGVITGLAAYLARGGGLVPFALTPNKVHLTTGAADARRWQAAMRRGFPLAFVKEGAEFLGAAVDLYWEHPYYNRERGAGLARERDDLRREVEGLRAEAATLRTEVAALRGSTSWRVTAPLRSLPRVGRREPG